jgi:quinohemoprotein ethanol dehydrogenase
MLLAWDPVAGREVWRIENTGMANGGTFATSGNLLIQGTDSGHLHIYRADDGQLLRKIHIGTKVMGGAMSYSLDGEQYIAVQAGYGGGLAFAYSDVAAPRQYENFGRILAFKLGGGPVPLPPTREAMSIPEPHRLPSGRRDLLARGADLYTEHCAICHGVPGTDHAGIYPNLGAMSDATHALFDRIVLNGLFTFGGMARFDDLLTETDSQAIHEHLIAVQAEAYAAQAGRTPE